MLAIPRESAAANTTIVALLKVIYCLEEICRGAAMGQVASERLKALLLSGYGSMEPDALSRLAGVPFSLMLEQLLPFALRANQYGAIFVEMLVSELLVEFMPRLASSANIPDVGNFLDAIMLPLLHFVCCLINRHRIPEPEREAAVRATAAAVVSASAPAP